MMNIRKLALQAIENMDKNKFFSFFMSVNSVDKWLTIA